jgi:hypothetical protein
MKSNPKLWEIEYTVEIPQLATSHINRVLLFSTLKKIAEASTMINNEIEVMIPNPRPILPNNCCVKGASLTITTSIVWIIINKIIKISILILLSFKASDNE